MPQITASKAIVGEFLCPKPWCRKRLPAAHSVSSAFFAYPGGDSSQTTNPTLVLCAPSERLILPNEKGRD
jgi:hypothetical protein